MVFFPTQTTVKLPSAHPACPGNTHWAYERPRAKFSGRCGRREVQSSLALGVYNLRDQTDCPWSQRGSDCRGAVREGYSEEWFRSFWHVFKMPSIFKILFIFRGKGKERGRETSTGCLSHAPQPGTEPTAQACALTRTGTYDLSVCSAPPSPFSRTSRDRLLACLQTTWRTGENSAAT